MACEADVSCKTGGQSPLQLLDTLNTLKTLWAKKEIEEQLRKQARMGFAGLEDPLTGLLDMLEGCSEWKGKGHSLVYCILNEFQQWIKDHPSVQQSGLKLKKLQARVFGILAGNIHFLDSLISIYQLHSADRNYLLGHVSHLYHMGLYKEALILSMKLNLQLDQDLEKMCTPLLLQDKMNLVEAYVADHSELQCRLLQILDSWSDPNFNPRDIARQYQALPHMRMDKFNHKGLSKLVFRLLDQFDLDPALCPNIINQRHLGTLKYLFYKRFIEKSMTRENWTDHIQSTVGENRWLQEQLMNLLLKYCDLETVAWWAVHYSLPKESLPCGVAEEMQNLKILDRTAEFVRLNLNRLEGYEHADFQEERKNSYYQFPLPREKVHFLQSWKEMELCKEEVLKPGQVVGLDMEWRPSFGTVGRPRVSLFQIAVKEHVFLLDLLKFLKEARTDEEGVHVTKFIQTMFCDPGIIKLGYGMAGDLHSLAFTHPALQDLDKKVQGLVDLLNVHKQLQKCKSSWAKGSRKVDALPEKEERRVRQPQKGLSLLVYHVLGKPLDKTQQLSNWEKRPLREEQLMYAACDAYCLLEVFEALIEDPTRFGLTLNLKDCLAEMRLQTEQEKPTASKKSSQDVGKNASIQSPLTSPQEVSVVCDNMLQGLGRYLRCLGVDVKMLENDDDHRKAAEIAREEGRVILTCGMPYQTLCSQVGEGKCFYVNCSEKAKQQAIKVLKHFNIHVTVGDIFSRCQRVGNY
ncbi:exonuclease mut-7 homolog [Microcaecilia unicolor]|uniref:Exonuclease mut-7 homolog n=1 Tax=Microcaecilia unicolor TaxID=1415580 RepID=A0A6P7YIC1_9AMPH|nr:exonuclease mut-7 homolog [Microcaecilia unicolor]